MDGLSQGLFLTWLIDIPASWLTHSFRLNEERCNAHDAVGEERWLVDSNLIEVCAPILIKEMCLVAESLHEVPVTQRL